MGVRETCVIYLLVGAAVAFALALRGEGRGPAGRAAMALAGLFFWPLFAPLILAGSAKAAPAAADAALDARIRAAEEQLVGALSRVQGVAESVIAPEVTRVRGVAGAMSSMERRVREMDALLGTREFDARAAELALAALKDRGLPEEDPRLSSVRSRLRNIDRLRGMRARTADDLERIILKLEEMGSQIGLLGFAGHSDAEVVQLIKEIAASVEEATEGLLEAG